MNTLEFSNEQLDQIDRVYTAVNKMCSVLVDDPDLKLDMSVLGSLTEDICEYLARKGFRVYFPSHVIDGDDERIDEYYEVVTTNPEKKDRKQGGKKRGR